MKIRSYDELKEIVRGLKEDCQLRQMTRAVPGGSHEIVIGLGEKALENGSFAVLNKFLSVLREKGIRNVRVVRHGDFGHFQEPTIVKVSELGKDTVTYYGVDLSFVEKIVDAHFVNCKELHERRLEA